MSKIGKIPEFEKTCDIGCRQTGGCFMLYRRGVSDIRQMVYDDNGAFRCIESLMGNRLFGKKKPVANTDLVIFFLALNRQNNV
jgi:hypothetical protein